MTIQKPTPEEKLFAVIQGAHHSGPRAKATTLSLGKIGAMVFALIGPMTLPRVNRLLMWVVGMLAALCLISPVTMQPRVSRVLLQAQRQVSPFVIAPPLEGLKSSDAYVQLIREQDPFRIEATHQEPTRVQQPPEQQGPSAKDVVADLKLVGISWGEEPVAMIEQGSSKQTHVLKVGDVLGAVTVKTILPDRVVLRVGEEEVELF